MIDIRRLTAYNIGESVLSLYRTKMERKFMEFMTVKETATKWDCQREDFKLYAMKE